MNIVLYGRNIQNEHIPYLDHLLKTFEQRKIKPFVFENFYDDWKNRISVKPVLEIIKTGSELPSNIDFIFSIGGDGTLLNSINVVKNSGIPILGINTGRLGFLSGVGTEEIDYAINALVKKDFTIDSRSLLNLKTENDLFGDLNSALNEITVRATDTNSMITIHAYLNDKLLNSYWADGLIISTPTGATAYSLSCGGPIVSPNCENFVITPISPHNLNVRPIVISDKDVIKLKVEGRVDKFLVSLDSRSKTITSDVELIISKANYQINLVRLANHEFLSTLRKKLMWGADKRN
ncbi:MAG: NAD kinase [Bacteroidota bacterium]